MCSSTAESAPKDDTAAMLADEIARSTARSMHLERAQMAVAALEHRRLCGEPLGVDVVKRLWLRTAIERLLERRRPTRR